MSVIHYFAYGSNLHPLRLTQRIPSARLMGTGKLPGFKLTFHKRGQDTSGKGHIQATENQSNYILGAVYQLAVAHKSDLDIVEGPGYESSWLDIAVDGVPYTCFAYVGVNHYLDIHLQPFQWYKTLVVLGAQFHGFSADYIRSIQQTPAAKDPDLRRQKQNELLIEDMLKFRKSPES